MDSLNVVDAVAIGVVSFSLVIGAVRGLTGEFARICALFAGLFCGWFSTGFWQTASLKIVPEGGSPLLRGVCVTVGILLTAAAVSALVRWALKKSLRLLMGQPYDAVFGAVLGVARGFALFAGVLFLASFAMPDSARRYVFEDSYAGRRAAPAVEWARGKFAAAREGFAPALRVPGDPETTEAPVAPEASEAPAD